MHPILLLLASAAAAEVPTPPDRIEYRDAVLHWNETALQAIKEDRTAPPVAARGLALLHAAIYDAVNAIDRTHTVFHVDATPPLGASMEAAASGSAYRVLTQLYPKQKKRFDAALDAALREVAGGPARDDGLAFGQGVADKMLAWRAEDGSDRKGPFVSESAPGLWEPTPPDFTPALLPHWSEVTPFVPARAGQFRPPAPPALTSKEYTADFKEVKALGRADSTKRKPEQTIIAWFWEDGSGTVTPPGHWNRIAQTVARAKKTTLVENARLFAVLNFAIADAGVLCWECKYKHRLWRPVLAIRNAADDDNPDTDADAEWSPLLPTPPFPSYVSGHSSFSGAAAAVLADVFGDETTVVAKSDAFPGMKRTFSSFSALAQECGRSRIYGGIHYECDNRAGLEMGNALGHYCARTVLRERRGGPEGER
jgi:membrane-associated phospholipid phosphatase